MSKKTPGVPRRTFLKTTGSAVAVGAAQFIPSGVLAAPGGWSRGKQAGLLVLFLGLAVVPDWPLPGWGHDRYAVSHSVFVNLGLILLAAGAYGGSRPGGSPDPCSALQRRARVE